MASRKELLAASAAIRNVLEAGAGVKLRTYPGVEHVSVGLKVSGNVVSDDLCIRVYVREKRPESELAESERIPPEIDGVVTDVLAIRGHVFTANYRQYRPLVGGCMISNLIVARAEGGFSARMGVGTFGCTATRNHDNSTVLLSNWHIIMANGARFGDAIYQPAPILPRNIDLSLLPVRIGRSDDVIAHIIRGVINERVDAAIARLDISSCCRCCGLDYEDEITGLSEGGSPPSNGIIGRRAAVEGATVYKVGAGTGRTVGRISELDAPEMTGRHEGEDHVMRGQIEIVSQDTDEYFSTDGDSGSAIIDEEGFIVGLLFGSFGSPPDATTYANHIDDVCDALNIEIKFAESHGTAGARVAPQAKAMPPVLSLSRQELYAKTQARLKADPAGAWLWALAEKHREEILTLVTEQRRVSVVWHRAGGPAVFALALENLRAGDDDTLPSPPNGVTLVDALARLGSALAAHGSTALQVAIAEHREALLDSVRGSTTLGDILDKLRPYALSQTRQTAEEPA